MIELFSFHMMLIYAVLYGATMKIADLLNEHGLKGFRGSNIIFGALWGIFGALLILGNVFVANLIFAMNLAFIVRRRIDYVNHAIATAIIIITFFIYSTFDITILIPFFLVFAIFGGLKDYVDDKMKKKGTLFLLTESMLYYPIPTFIYSWFYGNWIVFYVFLVYTISYNLTKYLAMKKGYK